MKEKQNLHVFGEQGAWAGSPATEEQHPHCLSGQSELCWRGDIENAFAQTLDHCLVLLRGCTSEPPPRCSRSPRGPCRAGCPLTICFSSHSQRSRLQPYPCCEDLGGGFWIVFHYQSSPCCISARGCVGLLAPEGEHPTFGEALRVSPLQTPICTERQCRNSFFAPMLPEPRRTKQKCWMKP